MSNWVQKIYWVEKHVWVIYLSLNLYWYRFKIMWLHLFWLHFDEMHLATDNWVSYLQNPSGNCAKCCDISFHSDSKCDRIHTDLYFSRYHILDHNGRTTLPCKDIPVNFQENVLRNYELFRSCRWNIVLDVSPSF